jgi:hypothetical protein
MGRFPWDTGRNLASSLLQCNPGPACAANRFPLVIGYMTRTEARYRHGAHLLLLAALLLYIGSVAVEPLVHAAAPAAAELAVGDVDGDDTSSVDHECSVCKLTRAFTGAAATTPPAPEAATYVRVTLDSNDDIRGPPSVSTSQPRAPPHA